MALILVLLFVTERAASAQVDAGSIAAPLSSAAVPEVKLPAADAPNLRAHRTIQPIRDSLSTVDYGRIAAERVPGASLRTASPGRKRSVMRRILGGAIGATAGLFAGGYLGAVIEGDRCDCDDPGLKGALIGAPVGAVTGGVLGALYF